MLLLAIMLANVNWSDCCIDAETEHLVGSGVCAGQWQGSSECAHGHLWSECVHCQCSLQSSSAQLRW